MSKVNGRRRRPPNINLTLAIDRQRPAIKVQADSPLDNNNNTILLSGDEFKDTLQLSSSSDSSNPASPAVSTLNITASAANDGNVGDISKDLAELQELRKSVQTNLRLRPIRSHNSLPKVAISPVRSLSASNPQTAPPKTATIPSTTSIWTDVEPLNKDSPISSAISTYFTPITEFRPSAASAQTTFAFLVDPNTPSPEAAELASLPIPPGILYSRLTSAKRPLLIDTRPPTLHLAFHICYSINIAIPTLLLKRSRKQNGGFQSLDALRSFVTTEQGKASWDELLAPDGPWDGDIVVYDDEMDPRDKSGGSSTAWVLISVLAPLLKSGFVSYLEGGISAAGYHPDLETLIVTPDDNTASNDPPAAKTPQTGTFKKGLFQLDTGTASRSKPLPELDQNSASSSSTASTPPASRSPLPLMPASISSTSSPSSSLKLPRASKSATTSPRISHTDITDPSPSPPPSQITFRRPVPPARRPSVPNLRRLDTSTTDRLSLRTKPGRSATLTVPPSLPLTLQVPTSPSHLNLVHSNYSPPGSARRTPKNSPPLASAANGSGGYPISGAETPEQLTPYYTPPHTPCTPRPLQPPPSMTVRPELDTTRTTHYGYANALNDDDTPLSSDEEFLSFNVSTILPNFLFLGPELTAPEHVQELRDLGVRRILNIAAECDDDNGLRLREVFEKYVKIPMRDTVEEKNISWGVREVCNVLDDARLHSAPTYVHCKAGKSRSVTAVIAYLIHANHWTVDRAYAFVLERRKGISPNIGFVSELMAFEKQELRGKMVGGGVQPVGPPPGSEGQGGQHANGSVGNGSGGGSGSGSGAGAGGPNAAMHQFRRVGHIRESLPPTLTTSSLSEGPGGSSLGPLSAGGLVALGDSGQELEIKDASGRYRHARRAPVDETTLQPMRRVSKAGLESSGFS
ncbi:hypothetical protein AMATHDRAFT_67571 [Amanita thiersii Skay4041]|uniref:protein-tyrosine-phosphatase n=1 Tax=Amanita thiersii Skay4041 TaxID=703135 RepID=A0A2A9NE14_9AGAR|nr:hypothetical protein AMATHDRAFT_67571 [Amanita thiersii Skay4041]